MSYWRVVICRNHTVHDCEYVHHDVWSNKIGKRQRLTNSKELSEITQNTVIYRIVLKWKAQSDILVPLLQGTASALHGPIVNPGTRLNIEYITGSMFSVHQYEGH